MRDNTMRDEDLDEVTDKSPEPRGYSWLALLVAIAISSIAGLVAGATFGFLMALPIRQAQQTVQQTPARKAQTLEELQKTLMGASQEDVIQKIGRPDVTHDSIAEWHYFNGRYNPITQRTDGLNVRFTKGEKPTVIEVR